MSVSVQQERFSAGEEYDRLLLESPGAAMTTFTGYVREFSKHGDVATLELEHYPGMAERVLGELGVAAASRFSLLGWRIVHRYGALSAGEIIVWVGTVAQHRAEAFAACEYIMDVLKTDAPFWKQEQGSAGGQWVEAQERDTLRRQRW